MRGTVIVMGLERLQAVDGFNLDQFMGTNSANPPTHPGLACIRVSHPDVFSLRNHFLAKQRYLANICKDREKQG